MNLSHPLTFAAGGGDLDRASHLRPDSAALLARADARLLPQWHEKALIELSGERPALPHTENRQPGSNLRGSGITDGIVCHY